MAFTCSMMGMSRQPSMHLHCSTSVTCIVNGSGLTNSIELGVLLVLVVNDILVHPSLHLFSRYCQCTGSFFFLRLLFASKFTILVLNPQHAYTSY